jgi:hypothetical protein
VPVPQALGGDEPEDPAPRLRAGLVNAWLADLHQLGTERQYFFSLNRYLFLATR